MTLRALQIGFMQCVFIVPISSNFSKAMPGAVFLNLEKVLNNWTSTPRIPSSRQLAVITCLFYYLISGLCLCFSLDFNVYLF